MIHSFYTNPRTINFKTLLKKMKNNLKKSKFAILSTALFFGSFACTTDIDPAEELTGINPSRSARVTDYTLRSVADFTIGVHEDSYRYEDDQACKNSIIGEYDRITSQAMKMGTIQGTKGTYDYTTLDKEIKFASDNGKSVVWRPWSPRRCWG